MVLDIFALVVIAVMIAAAIAIIVKLGPIPGNIAKDRGHPQADAIAVLGQQDAVARGRIATSLVSTYRALGGGWQLREGNSVVHPSTLDTMRERTDWGNLLDN